MKKNKIMKHLGISILVFFALISCQEPAKKATDEASATKDTLITIENKSAILTISLFGGAYIDFRLNGTDINPLSFRTAEADMPINNRKGAPFQGHFICLGRWGAPTAGEIEAGVPHNGQVTNTIWTREKISDNRRIVMSNYAPRDGMGILRNIRLIGEQSLFHVTEEIKNGTTIARLNNVVQHATFAPPFLDETTVVNSNAGKGFLQALCYPDPHKYEFTWPNGYLDEKKRPVDLTSSATGESYVSTHIFTDEYGWVAAYTPSKELLIGYIWPTKEYPFLNVWHEVKNNKPWAKGLEFGTTGIGKPYQDLLAVDTRFHGINSFELLDAGQSVTKSFVCFLLKIPSDYKGIEKIEMDGTRIIIREKGNRRSDEFAFNGFNK